MTEHEHQWVLLTGNGWENKVNSRGYKNGYTRRAECACPCGAFQTTTQYGGEWKSPRDIIAGKVVKEDMA